MCDPDDGEAICHAARLIETTALIDGSEAIVALYDSVGLTPEALAHMIVHAQVFARKIDVASFAVGALIARLSDAQAEAMDETLTDHDLKELLNPLP